MVIFNSNIYPFLRWYQRYVDDQSCLIKNGCSIRKRFVKKLDGNDTKMCAVSNKSSNKHPKNTNITFIYFLFL